MEKTMTIVSKIRGIVLGGAKIPHGISNPILRQYEDQIYMSFFVYVYNKDDMMKKKYKRPISWALVDIESGELVREIKCEHEDFSIAKFDELCDFNDTEHTPPDKESMIQNYLLFDTIRKKILNNENYIIEYNKYLDNILLVTPVAYRRFYTELNNIEI